MRTTNPARASETAQLWAIVWPLILTNLLNVLVGIIDLKMVGVLGVTSIAAVGTARQVMMFVMVLMIAVSGGSSVIIAHAYGAGEQDRVSLIAARTMVLMALTAVLIVTPIGLLAGQPLLVALGAGADVVEEGTGYLRILFLGSVCTMANIGVSGLLLGIGRTKVSLALLLTVNSLNIILNYLFIFGVGPLPAFGVAGAALGTVMARGIGSIAGLWIVTTPRLPLQARFAGIFPIELAFIRTILFLGGPRSLQGIVRNASSLLTIRIITLLPDQTRIISAYSVGMQVRMISTFIGLAFMAAAMSRVGQNLGAGDPDAAERSGWTSAWLATVLMTGVALLMFVFPEQIMGFFTDDAEVIALGRPFFMTIALTEPIMAFAFAMSGSLRGGGDPMRPFLYASLSDLLVIIAVGYGLAVVFELGFFGIAAAIAISALTRAIPITITFHRGRWKSTRL